MAVKTEFNGGVLYAYIFGDVDHHTSAEIRNVIDDRLTGIKPSELCIDFENVTFMDSSGVGLVMGRYKRAVGMGCGVKVVNLKDKYMKIMKMSGIDKIAGLERIDKK